MFATIFLPVRTLRNGERMGARHIVKELILTAFNLDKLWAKIKRVPQYSAKAFNYPVFVVAVFRGCVDTTLNAFVIGGVGLLLTFFGTYYLFSGTSLSLSLIDPLIYKNVFWWGLDLIADGNVLIFIAGTWYLIVPLLLNRQLYGEPAVRTVILADLVISLFVWNHHMLADTPQPLALQIQGQIFTWGELITMGLTMFAVLATIWKARPVKYSAPLKFVLASITGYAHWRAGRHNPSKLFFESFLPQHAVGDWDTCTYSAHCWALLNDIRCYLHIVPHTNWKES